MIERKHKILVVEDEILPAEEIKNLLIDAGYDVMVEYSGEDAVDKVFEYCPDLVIMDIVLRGAMDGVQAAELIKSRIDVPIIYLTAFLSEDLIKKARYSLPYTYISKPYKPEDLLAAVYAALNKHKEHGDLNKVVTDSVEKVVIKLQKKVDHIEDNMIEMSKEVKTVKDTVNVCADKINIINSNMQGFIKSQFELFFGDSKQHIIDHAYIKDHRDNAKVIAGNFKKYIIGAIVSALSILFALGLLNWVKTGVHSVKWG